MQEIVIKMPNKFFKDIKESYSLDLGGEVKKVIKAIKNGTPLPKGHGRLVDADEIERTHKGDNWDLHKVLKNAPTIIEADKGE